MSEVLVPHRRACDGFTTAVEALGSMKGAPMKLGQMASALDAGTPEPPGRAPGQRSAHGPRTGGCGRRG